MTWSIGSTLTDAWQMQDWVAVEARLSNAGYATHSGEDSDTYEAYAEYTYVYQGQRYGGTRVAIAGGADNIGDYQQDLGRELASAWSNGQPVSVFVNPENPAEAIYDRSIRWGLIGFKSIFMLVFGGVGLGLLIYVFLGPTAKDPNDPQFADRPWLANDKWQGDPILSNAKLSMYAMWGFAAFWNLISAPLPFVLYGEVVDKGNWPALLGLLFPLEKTDSARAADAPIRENRRGSGPIGTSWEARMATVRHSTPDARPVPWRDRRARGRHDRRQPAV